MSFVWAEKTWAHVLLSTQSLNSGFLENPSLIALAGRRWTSGSHFCSTFLIFVKMVLLCENEHFMVSEASRPAAHGLSSTRFSPRGMDRPKRRAETLLECQIQ